MNRKNMHMEWTGSIILNGIFKVSNKIFPKLMKPVLKHTASFLSKPVIGGGAKLAINYGEMSLIGTAVDSIFGGNEKSEAGESCGEIINKNLSQLDEPALRKLQKASLMVERSLASLFENKDGTLNVGAALSFLGVSILLISIGATIYFKEKGKSIPKVLGDSFNKIISSLKEASGLDFIFKLFLSPINMIKNMIEESYLGAAFFYSGVALLIITIVFSMLSPNKCINVLNKQGR